MASQKDLHEINAVMTKMTKNMGNKNDLGTVVNQAVNTAFIGINEEMGMYQASMEELKGGFGNLGGMQQ